MIHAIRTIPLLLVALSLGVFQACACVHDRQGVAAHGAHQGHAVTTADPHAGHGAYATAAATEDAHADACGATTPACDHAPDGAALVASASVDLGSKLAYPHDGSAPVPAPVPQRQAQAAVGQTGPPQRGQDPFRSTPVSLKVRLLN